jgi:putative membrane protein
MTAFMVAMHRALPAQQRDSLPPRKLTMHVAARLGLKQHMDEPTRQGATLVSHFAYGTAAGVGYGLLADRIPVHPLIKGTAYGLAVWTGSYLGVIPALGMPEAAAGETRQRNILMIAAHVIWGSAMGTTMKRLDR